MGVIGRWGKADFRELEQLRDRMEQLEKVDFDQFYRNAANEIAAILLAKAIKRTPVGKKPTFKGSDGKALPRRMKVTGTSGKARSFLTREGVILSQYWSGYVGGNLRRQWSAGTVKKTGDVYEIEIINSALYAMYVEYGHRQQPGRFVPAIGKCLKSGWVKGRFMLTIASMEVEAMAPAMLEQMLMNFIKGALEC